MGATAAIAEGTAAAAAAGTSAPLPRRWYEYNRDHRVRWSRSSESGDDTDVHGAHRGAAALRRPAPHVERYTRQTTRPRCARAP